MIKYWKELQSEVKRLKAELQQNQSNPSQKNNLNSFPKILFSAKGPLGIITIISLIIVIVLSTRQKSIVTESTISQQNEVTNTPEPAISGIQGIIYQGKKFALSEFIIGTGSDCDSPHYHAPGETTVASIDGEKIQDPGGCGFGKVKEVPVITIQ